MSTPIAQPESATRPEPAAQRRPTLLGSCALATTAAEARYRITAPAFTRRSSRVIALDEESRGIVRDMGSRSWGGGHFLVFESAVPGDALLRHAGTGGTALLSEELDGADTVVMVGVGGRERGGGCRSSATPPPRAASCPRPRAAGAARRRPGQHGRGRAGAQRDGARGPPRRRGRPRGPVRSQGVGNHERESHRRRAPADEA